MAKTAKIAVVGSYNVGLVAKVGRMPAWGETILGTGFSEGPGGKGSNQAVASTRLGGNVFFIGCIGNDHFGDDALHMLQDENVDVSYVVRTDKTLTGVGFVLVNNDGENCIIIDPGANSELLPEHVKAAHESLDQSDILLVQLENKIETIEYAMKYAKGNGKTVVLNPAPAQRNMDQLLKHADIVTPNESELKILSNIDPSKDLSEEEYVELGRNILLKGPNTVIITRGEKGALTILQDRIKVTKAPRVTPLDTTGAGDAFNAALSVALGEGKTIDEAVQFACYVGAFTVTGSEVIPSLPTREQINEFIQQDKNAY